MRSQESELAYASLFNFFDFFLKNYEFTNYDLTERIAFGITTVWTCMDCCWVSLVAMHCLIL